MSQLHVIGNLKVGGMEKVIENIYSHFPESNDKFLVFQKKYEYQIKLPKNVEIKYCNNNLFKFFYFLLTSKIDLNFWAHPSIFFSIFLFFKKNKIIWHIHNSDISIKFLGIRNYLLVLVNSCFSHFIPSKIIVCSNYSKLIHKNFLFAHKKIFLIRNPSSKIKIRRKKSYIKKKYLKFIMVANYTKAKNFDLLFEILSSIKSYAWTCDLYGYNLINNFKLKKKIIKYDLSRSIFLKEQTNLSEIYKNYDFLFLTSKTESQPMSIYECLLSKTPCISTHVGDLDKLFKNEIIFIPNKFDFTTKKTINSLFKFRNNINEYKNLSFKSYNKVISITKKDLSISNYKKIWNIL